MNKIICAFYNCEFSLFFNRECPDADSVVSSLISKTNAYASIVNHYNLMKLNLGTVPAMHYLSDRGFSILIT